jgi:DNA-binding PadR family transcriptional regulator
VPFEELVIQAWKDYPDQFSLRNHPEYPDSYRIYNRIYTTLITERWLVSLRKQVYRLTDKGLDLARELELRDPVRSKEKMPTKTKFTREEEEFLNSAIKSRALTTWKQNKKTDLIDYDARVFFQFSTGTPVRERKRKLENARDAIEKAVTLGLPEATALNDLFQFFTKKFPALFEES